MCRPCACVGIRTTWMDICGHTSTIEKLRNPAAMRRLWDLGGQKWWRTQNVLIANFFYQVIKENCMPYVRLLPPSKNGVLLILPYDNVYRSMCESHTYEELATQVLPYDRHSHLLEWYILYETHDYWVLSCKICKILFLHICVHECNISKHDLARGLKKLHFAIRGHRGKV